MSLQVYAVIAGALCCIILFSLADLVFPGLTYASIRERRDAPGFILFCLGGIVAVLLLTRGRIVLPANHTAYIAVAIGCTISQLHTIFQRRRGRHLLR